MQASCDCGHTCAACVTPRSRRDRPGRELHCPAASAFAAEACGGAAQPRREEPGRERVAGAGRVGDRAWRRGRCRDDRRPVRPHRALRAERDDDLAGAGRERASRRDRVVAPARRGPAPRRGWGAGRRADRRGRGVARRRTPRAAPPRTGRARPSCRRPGRGRAPRSRPPATGRRAAAGSHEVEVRAGDERVRRGGRSRDSAAFAPASGSIERSPSGATSTTHVPVGSAGSVATRVSTPWPRNRAAAPRPASSSPARATSVTAAPATASHAATFAPAPPGRVRTRAGRVAPRRERRGHARDDVDHEVAEDDDRPAAGALKRRPRRRDLAPRARRCAARGARSRRGSRRRSRGGSGRAGTG